MVMTVSEFTSIFQFIAQLFFGAFKALDYPFFTDGGVTITILTIFLGLFIINALVDKILDWIQGV